MAGRTYVALLRAVNVTGHNPLAMKDLRTVVEATGAENVATYLQSGNVVFRSEMADPDRVRRALESRIESQLGITVGVVVRTAEQLQRVVSANPLWHDDRERAHLYVTFLAGVPDSDRTAALAATAESRAPELFRIQGLEVYLYCPTGYGRTKLNNAFFERKLAVAATTRNWRTVTALAEMAQP